MTTTQEEQMPTVAEALAALDAMDDYARMDVGVDAMGPREVLRRFIASRTPPAEQQQCKALHERLRSGIGFCVREAGWMVRCL